MRNKKEVMFIGGDCRTRLITPSIICEIISFWGFAQLVLARNEQCA